MLRAARYLAGLEGQVDEVLAHRAGEHLPQNAKIPIRLIFGHDAGAGTVLGNNLLVVIDIAAIDGSHVAAIPTHMAANFANFLFVHV